MYVSSVKFDMLVQEICESLQEEHSSNVYENQCLKRFSMHLVSTLSVSDDSFVCYNYPSGVCIPIDHLYFEKSLLVLLCL